MNSSVPFTKQTLNKSWSNKQVDPEETIEEMEIINLEEAIEDHKVISAITEEETVDHAVLFLDRAPPPTEWGTQTTTTILNKPIKPTTTPQTTNKQQPLQHPYRWDRSRGQTSTVCSPMASHNQSSHGAYQ
ncbi:hypothetical protein G6F51_014486 [Rhizopus arrhizus]|nr:hypothetical protein G6F51_014486 [Rhizopus arrhizus]